jgi:apolipoprotein N-acyltransferase
MEDWTAQYTARYNTAFLYRPDGTQSPLQYNKIHLVPFGEVVPFKKSAPWLYRILMIFTPYDYDYSLDYGTEYTIFPIEVEKRIYKFGVMICYEDTVPKIARTFALDEHGKKRLDWLVNISNDGWFVRYTGGKVYPSAELAQHTAVCVFRAIENRLAVVRSVNTGISCIIDTLGNIKNDFQAGNLPNNAMERQGVAGWFVDTVPIDKRTTFFSKFSQWLSLCCAVALVLTAAAALSHNRKTAVVKGKKT